MIFRLRNSTLFQRQYGCSNYMKLSRPSFVSDKSVYLASKEIHTFGSGKNNNQKNSYFEKIVKLIMDSKFDRTYSVWFMCMMVAVFSATLMAQRHKYTYWGSDSSSPQIMDIDQLEKFQNKMKGEKKKDSKGIEDIMTDLYQEHVAGKEFEDWDNVRAPRILEPETIDDHDVYRAAKINQRSNENAVKFVTEDYGNIDEEDITFDHTLEEH